MSQPILLRGARQLLTLRGPAGARRGADLQNLGIIKDASVLIRDGVIVSVGPTRRLENLKDARGALEIPIEGRIITPGFIDPNLHLSLHRSANSSQPKRMTDFYEDTLALLRSCLQHGTVLVDAGASADGQTFHADIAVLRKLAKIGSSPVQLVRTWRINNWSTRASAGDWDSTLDTLLRRHLIDSIAVSVCDQEEVHLKTIKEAKMAGLPIKLAWAGQSREALTRLLYTLNPHSVYCYNSEFPAPIATALAGTRTMAVLHAGTQVFEGPISRVGRDLIDAGTAVALSSGYQSTLAGSFNMQMSMALAVTRMGLTPEEAWSAATINAAYAADCGNFAGSLEVGKQADLLVLNVADYRDVLQQFSINHVAMVFRNGLMVLNRTRWRSSAEKSSDRVRS